MIRFLKKIYQRKLTKKIQQQLASLREHRSDKLLDKTLTNLHRLHQMVLKGLRYQDKVKVAFFVVHASVWKLEELYRLMTEDERFEPTIVIIPYIVFGNDQMREDMNLAYALFTAKGYRVVKTFDEETHSWLDVRKAIHPDIIFYTNPHELTRPEYYINSFPDILSCYVQYSFHITHLHDMQYNQLFHNILWRAFYETNVHRGFAEQYATNKGNNIAVVGYAGTDIFLHRPQDICDPWKIKDPMIKRIIWAPHHTIDDDKSFLSYSSFLLYADFFLQLAHEYADQLQLAFKPHPILKPKLSDSNVWGKEKTDTYYAQWEKGANTQLFEADYADLFHTSDALIHDSASFMVEYLYLNKPSLYTLRDDKVTDRFNDFGKLAFQVHEHAHNEQDIIHFIQHTVLHGIDVKEEERKNFFNHYLIPPHGKSASANIIDEIKRFI